ncbi:MAG: DUF4091 domain-containing protein [Lachnospiraceae bacterium]|nr:DUF4091 domain-containing protein [Lachnospiraceae bacterium]
MTYQIFSENEWIYPDSVITQENEANLYCARNADTCFQLLTDKMLAGGESIKIGTEDLNAQVTVYQLLPAHVEENSDAKIFTTLDYESVKHFVTRQAPFDVYEITRPVDNGILTEGRAAFFIRFDIDKDAQPGMHQGKLHVWINGEKLTVSVNLKIYETQIPDRSQAAFHMNNWLYYDIVAKQHGMTRESDSYDQLLRGYFENLLDMRNDYLMIPAGDPVRDSDGLVVDFDFSHAEDVGNLALECGFKFILGGFVARFEAWDDPDQLLLWDRQVGASTIEGYRQLKLYFTRAWECVVKNGWQKQYMQCLVDEPQFPNSLSYRALAGICRSCMPGVKINDPVETTEVGGAIDVWVVKQAIFEKYLDTYQKLQKMGEEMWIYTCGFPGGATMNRIIDLPLTVSRLPMWLCYHYECPGFLHWGYHQHNPEFEKETCFKCDDIHRYPPGNSFVVYPAADGSLKPWYGVRGHIQRQGALDCEMFMLLEKKVSRETADELVLKVCRTFDDYDTSAQLLDEVRHELLEMLG